MAAVDQNVFKRPTEDPQNQSGSVQGTKDENGPKTEKNEKAERRANEKDTSKGEANAGPRKLKPAETRQVAELSERDRQVRAHEAAHQAAAGSLGGAASFTYETGPDGRSYAVGGEVPVDMSGGRTAAETATRAAQIRAAALAPADPSPQDLAVAATATAMEAAARQQMTREQSTALRAAGTAPKKSSSATPSDHQVEIRLPGQPQREAEAARPGGGGLSELEAAKTTAVSDVSDQVAATTAALESSRASTGPSVAQLQQLARLATLAYRRMGGA